MSTDPKRKYLKKPLRPSVDWTQHGLRQIVRRWEVDSEAVKAGNIESELFLARDTTDHEYTTARLVDQGVSSGREFGVAQQYFRVFQELPADTATLVQIGEDQISFTENGLMTVQQNFVARAGHVLAGVVGTTDTTVQGTGVILAGNAFGERGKVSATVVKRWAEPGILDADTTFNKDGILYVTFISQGNRIRPTALAAGKALTDDPHEAFFDGAEAPLFRNRIRNINGFRQYVTTVMLKHDGSVLANNDTVRSKKVWHQMRFPGVVDLTFDEGIVPRPGSTVKVRVELTETMTTSNDVGATPVPFYIKAGAFANVRWTPQSTGVRQSSSRGLGENYLSGTNISGTGTSFLGEPAAGVTGTVGSNPAYLAFLNLNEPILDRELVEDMVTDEGIQWYRIRQMQLIGTFGSYLS